MHPPNPASPLFQPCRFPAPDLAGAAKAGRAVVLTTHSMEEADILGDQIAIMARGRCACGVCGGAA